MAKATETKAKKPASKSTARKSTSKSTKKSTTTKKSTSPKKSTPKKAPVKQPEPEKKPLFQRKTIAERTVAFKTRNWGAVFCRVGVVFFLLLALFFQFCMIGYSFTVLVCIGLAAVLLFYALIPIFAKTYPRTARRLKKVFTTILCIGLIVVAVTEFFIIRSSFGQPDEACSYVVVLGAKVRHDGPSVSLMDRIYGARDYLEDHPDVIAVLSGGQGQDEPMSEAQAMYNELVALGIDPARLWMEDKATSTWENLTFSLDLIEEKTGVRPEKIGIVSSEYHLFRAGLFADACNVESVGIPARTSIISQRINHFMREVAGVWHYLILGGQYA